MSVTILSDDSSQNTSFDDLPEINLGPSTNPESGESKTVKAIKKYFIELSQDENGEKNLRLDNIFPCTKQISRTNSEISADSGVCVPNGSSGSSEAGSSGTKRHGDDKVTENRTTTSKRQTKKKLTEERAASVKMKKIYKPGECMKYMNVEMHPSLLDAWYAADVEREVGSAGARVACSTNMLDGLVMWSRSVQPLLEARDGQVELSASNERCDRALYIMCAEQVATHVGEHTLAKHVEQMRLVVDCRLTLVVFGVKDYFKSKGRKTQNSERKLMTQIEMEMAFTDLLVSADCDTAIVNTSNELALLIVQFTKAIAETPYKKTKQVYDEQADFYMRGAKKKCVHVESDGRGLKQLWQQMIAVFPSSSLETSRALCAQYKSPLQLYEALQSSCSVNELADLGVSRAAVPGSKARRLGPEFAKKLHTLFTAYDGDRLLE